MISFIIPYYNLESSSEIEQLLLRAISSITMQLSDDQFEILVIDDGSPTPPVTVVEAGNIFLHTIPHGFLGAARNYGIEHAKGDYIAFIDADDYYFPATLAKHVEYVNEHPDTDLLMFSFLECYDGKGMVALHQQTPVISGPVAGKDFLLNNHPSGSACQYLIRRKVLINNHIRFAQNTYIEDEDFTARVLYLSRNVCSSKQYVYAYYRRQGSIVRTVSNARNKELNRAALDSIKRIQAFAAKFPAEENLSLIKRISTISIDVFRRSLRASNHRELVRNTKAALKEMHIYPIPVVQGMGIRFSVYAIVLRFGIGRWLLRLYELDRQ